MAVIVLAAGSGERFGGAKQFAVLAGERLVDRAVRLVTDAIGPPVLALPPGVEWDGPPVAAVVAGGSSRLESLALALAAVDPAVEVVVVHDPARPLARPDTFHRLVAAIKEGADAAIPVWTLPDTLKSVGADGSLRHRGRDEFVMAQSPMAFRAPLLRVVLDKPDGFGAMVEETIAVEQAGGRVVGITGDRWSHHVVEPRDLEMMERLLAGEALASTTGSTMPDSMVTGRPSARAEA